MTSQKSKSLTHEKSSLGTLLVVTGAEMEECISCNMVFHLPWLWKDHTQTFFVFCHGLASRFPLSNEDVGETQLGTLKRSDLDLV